MSIYKYDMLLFCKQIQRSKFTVYCVELDTLDNVQPRVHCYEVSFRLFLQMELGQVFRFEVRGTRILHSILEGTCELSEVDYELLQELRFRRFEQHKPRAKFDVREYFTFAELCSLYDYKEPIGRRFLLFLLRMLAYFACGIIPILLYTILIYTCFTDLERVYAGLFTSLGALPFMIYLVILLYTLTGILLLDWRETRYGMLRSFALRNCGMKRRLGISRAAIKKLVLYGAVSFGVFLISSIVALLV